MATVSALYPRETAEPYQHTSANISGGTVAGSVVGTLLSIALIAVGMIIGLLFLMRYWKIRKRKHRDNMLQMDILAM